MAKRVTTDLNERPNDEIDNIYRLISLLESRDGQTIPKPPAQNPIPPFPGGIKARESDGSPSFDNVAGVEFDSADGFALSLTSDNVARIDLPAITEAQVTNLISDLAAISASAGIALFDHFADANNGTTVETDLYSDTLSAGRLAANGEKIVAQYGGIFTGAVTATQDLRVYFGGTKIYDSGALSIGASTANWTLYATIIRESATVVRCDVSVSSDFATLFPYSTYTRVTGLTLSNTQVLKITGQAGGAAGASNQITATEGYGRWLKAA